MLPTFHLYNATDNVISTYLTDGNRSDDVEVWQYDFRVAAGEVSAFTYELDGAAIYLQAIHAHGGHRFAIFAYEKPTHQENPPQMDDLDGIKLALLQEKGQTKAISITLLNAVAVGLSITFVRTDYAMEYDLP